MVLITDLPADSSNPSEKELTILQTLFKNPNVKSQIKSEFKSVLIATVLFAIIAMKPMTKLIKRFVPKTDNPYVMLLVKSLLFFVAFYVTKKVMNA
jgi:hypothetical protein